MQIQHFHTSSVVFNNGLHMAGTTRSEHWSIKCNIFELCSEEYEYASFNSTGQLLYADVVLPLNVYNMLVSAVYWAIA